MTFRSFFVHSTEISSMCNLVISAIALVCLVTLLIYVLLSKMRGNVSLVLLLVTMVLATTGYCVEYVQVHYTHTHEYGKFMWIEYDTYVSFDTIVHWQFCAIYIKVAIETTFLLDQRIYTDKAFDFSELYRKRCWLKAANILSVMVFLAMICGSVTLAFMN